MSPAAPAFHSAAHQGGGAWNAAKLPNRSAQSEMVLPPASETGLSRRKQARLLPSLGGASLPQDPRSGGFSAKPCEVDW